MFDYYLSTLNEYLQEFLDRNEFDCCCSLGNDFAYFYNKSLITYTLIVTDSSAKSFLTFCKSLFPKINADIFLWSFLHELGHHETIDDFEDKEHQYYYHAINSDKQLLDGFYYNLPIEKAATMWAGQFMINNYNEVNRLWNNIQPIFQAINSKI